MAGSTIKLEVGSSLGGRNLKMLFVWPLPFSSHPQALNRSSQKLPNKDLLNEGRMKCPLLGRFMWALKYRKWIWQRFQNNALEFPPVLERLQARDSCPRIKPETMSVNILAPCWPLIVFPSFCFSSHRLLFPSHSHSRQVLITSSEISPEMLQDLATESGRLVTTVWNVCLAMCSFFSFLFFFFLFPFLVFHPLSRPRGSSWHCVLTRSMKPKPNPLGRRSLPSWCNQP